jgi:CRP-like cAMP-binding protein
MHVCIWQTAPLWLCWDAEFLAHRCHGERRVPNAGVTQNHLLRQLATSDPVVYERLYEDLQPTPLERGAQLGGARQRTEWVYFVDAGVVSLVGETSSGQSLEVAAVGREGVVGFADALGGRGLPYRLVVQLPGLAYRVKARIVREHVFSCTPLHELLMAYSQFVMHQLAQSAVCNRFHGSVQRLARWLLVTSERAGMNRLPLTHEFVAQMVGAPRSAVTAAAAELRAKRIIECERGIVVIRNARRLRSLSCDCVDAFTVSASAPAARTAAR